MELSDGENLLALTITHSQKWFNIVKMGDAIEPLGSFTSSVVENDAPQKSTMNVNFS